MRGRRMFSQLVQDILIAVGSQEGQFGAVVREIADGLNILEGPGVWVTGEWTAGGEEDCEHSHRGWKVLLWDCFQLTLCFDGKAKPFCHEELTVQRRSRTGGHCYLFGFSILVILLEITQKNWCSWWLRFIVWEWKPQSKGECVCKYPY